MTDKSPPFFPDLPLRSTVPHLKYPALSEKNVLPIIAYLYQLERAQWMDPARHRQLIFTQLDELLRTVFRTVPYYRETLGAVGYDPSQPLDEATWQRVPDLTRAALQVNGDRLRSYDIPAVMQPFRRTRSSGSTGMPVEVFHPATRMPMMVAASIMEYTMQRANFAGKAASIRFIRGTEHKDGPMHSPDWGSPFAEVLETGPATMMRADTDPEQQADWIIAEAPNYLQLFPSNLEAVLPILKDRGAELPSLHYIRTFGEQLPERIRDTVRDQLGIKIVDTYSAQESGIIALQCSETDNYHLVPDLNFTEILNDDGEPCAPGEIGKMVITDLFNPAFPLIRYEIGDYAEMGEPCSCGRGWPVIKRILGRVRNLITYPDGSRGWPSVPGKQIGEAVPMRQYQIVQPTIDELQVNLVMKRPLTDDDRKAVVAIVNDKLGKGFTVSVNEVAEIVRGANGKYEEFKSLLKPSGSEA